MTTRTHGHIFVDDPGRVFTPRPATEHLVDAAAERLGDAPARVADVGTGSGAIAIAIALRLPHVEVWMSDASRDALRLARPSASQLDPRVHVVRGDLLEGLPHDLDLIAASLPHLPEEAALSPDGLDHYRRLLAGAADHLSADGGVLIQYSGQVLEAERNELPWLSARLESLVAAAA